MSEPRTEDPVAEAPAEVQPPADSPEWHDERARLKAQIAAARTGVGSYSHLSEQERDAAIEALQTQLTELRVAG